MLLQFSQFFLLYPPSALPLQSTVLNSVLLLFSSCVGYNSVYFAAIIKIDFKKSTVSIQGVVAGNIIHSSQVME